MDQVHFKQPIHLEKLARMMNFSMLQVYLHARILSGWPDPPFPRWNLDPMDNYKTNKSAFTATH